MTTRARLEAARWICTATLATLLARAEAQPPQAPASRGVEIATAVTTLVAAGQETNLAAIGDTLHLPQLATQARFDGPRGRYGGAFRADYAVPGSALGIMDVHVEWQPQRGLGFSTELRLLIEADACPTREELTRISAGQVQQGFRPSPDELLLGVPAGRDDEIVQVRRLQVPGMTVNDQRVCTLYVDRRPALLPVVQPLD